MRTFHLPDLGEGLAEGEIVEWHVKVGETLEVDAPLVSVETAKAIVEVPAPYSGQIAKLYAKAGDIVPTGAPLVDFEGGKESSTVVGEIPQSEEQVIDKPLLVANQPGVKVFPAVRALAKKYKVDLSQITPTGADNTITAADVEKAHLQPAEKADNTAETAYEPLRGVRRSMAQAMIASHKQVVPVTVVEDVDITTWHQQGDITVRVIQAMIAACAQEPALNAWYDEQQMGRKLIKAVNIGLALDTEAGLFVPVIHQACQKSATELRSEIDRLKTVVSNREIAVKELQGATILLSNYGKFAGRYANPVIALPTVAILGVGAKRQQVLPIEQEPTTRMVLPLSLTIDHRAVTGGEATRFLATLIKELAKS